MQRVNISSKSTEPVDEYQITRNLDAPNVGCVRVLLDGSVRGRMKNGARSYEPNERTLPVMDSDTVK